MDEEDVTIPPDPLPQAQQPVSSGEIPPSVITSLDAAPEPMSEECSSHPEQSDECVSEERTHDRWLQPSTICFHAAFESDKLFRIKFTIEGGEPILLTALIDTGANRSLINRSVIPTSINFRLVNDLKLFGVGETDGVTAEGEVDLKLLIGHVPFNVESSVVLPSNVQLPVDMVLGSDFLRTARAKVNVEQKFISIPCLQGAVDLYFWPDGNLKCKMLRSVSCVVTRSTHVLPGSTAEVNVSWPELCTGLGDVLYIDNAVIYKHGEISCLPGVVDGSGHSTTILVTNTGAHSRQLKAGSVVGTASTALTLSADCNESQVYWSKERLAAEVDLSHLPADEALRVMNVLTDSQAVFSKGECDVSASSLPAHKIELLNNTPIYQRPRRFPAPIAEEIERQCQGLMNLGVIEASASPWSSPVVPIRKKDGSLRLCVDYRALNRVTKPDKFPMPNLTDSIFGLCGVRYFTKLDLIRGYYQMPLEPESKECTAFSTPHGHWHFNRLSFGMRNGPSAFQRSMTEILHEFSRKKVVVYVDDILIMETSFEKHLTLVAQVLNTLGKHNLKIRPDKCEWFKHSVEFLGHVVSERGVSKTRTYIERVMKFPKPENVRQLREFLGLVNFQRKFIDRCSELQKPLSAVAGGTKTKRLEWTDEMDNAFEALKVKISEDIQLAFPDYHPESEMLELWVDASHSGAGACLTQVQGGEMRMIAFASMTFDRAQKNYSILEKELAALRWGVKNFRAFLYGTEFVLRTDHQPLVYLHNMKLVDSRLARTLEDLADFNFTIKYTPGHLNVAADTLSRLRPLVQPLETEALDGQPELPPNLHIDGSLVPGGGNSLFESLLRVLSRVKDHSNLPGSHAKLRELLIDELIAHPELYHLKSNREMRRALRCMRKSHQLPCLEVLLAASRLFNVSIHVYFWSQNPVVYCAHDSVSEPEQIVHLQCVSGIHFNPLIAIHSYNVESVVPSCVVSIRPPDVECCGEVMPVVANENLCVDCFQAIEVNCNHDTFGRPVIPFFSGDEALCALLDTGSEVSLIRDSVRQRLKCINVPRSGTVIAVVGITGKTEELSRCVDVELRFDHGGDFITHRFIVVEDANLPSCVLLGSDFLAMHDVTLDMEHSLCFLPPLNTTLSFLQFPPQLSRAPHVGYVGVLRVNTPAMCVGPPDASVKLELKWEDSIVSAIDCLVSNDVIKRFQKRTSQLKLLRRSMKLPVRQWPKAVSLFRKHADKLTVIDDIIWYVGAGDKHLPVISFTLMVEVILVFHTQLAHMGRDKIIHFVSRQLFHPSIDKIARDVCSTCEQCQLTKSNPLQVAPPTLKIQTKHPFELVAADLVEFGRASSGYIGCLMVVDHNSKWLAAVPIRNKQSETVVRAFEEQVLPSLPRVPLRLLTDNGPEFKSSCFSAFVEKYGIKHTFSTPFMPSSNGAVERVNRLLNPF